MLDDPYDSWWGLGLGFRVYSLGFRVGLGFRVQGLGHKLRGFRASGPWASK